MDKVTGLAGQWRQRGDIVALAVIFLVGALIYGHTLNAPWYLDDNNAILENRVVHRLSEALADFFSGRGLANLTFAFNYLLAGEEVPGYHLVNIAIHLATSSLVYLLFKRVFVDKPLLALGGALVFLSHPLQTQAVTYIVQRMTSLAALLFFLAIYLYLLARERGDLQAPVGSRPLYWGALFCGALAVLTKQNTAVLPVALLIFERYFLPGGRSLGWRRLLLLLAPFCLVPVLVAAKSLLLPMLSQPAVQNATLNIAGLPDLVHLRNNSPLNYLVTQFSVIWLYLRLLFLPVGQALDYDIPIVTALWQWKNLVAFLGLALLLAGAFMLRKRQPLISAGIFWFFLGLSVESSIIPLDPVFEHRLYIPMFGFALMVISAVRPLPERAAATAIALLVGVLSILTWQRNALWNDPGAFHEDNLKRAPRSERVHLDLGNIYLKRGKTLEAQALYERALQINPEYVLIHVNLSRAYAAQQQYQKAVDILLEGLRRDPSRYKLYHNIGVLYNIMGRYQLAAGYLGNAARMEPENAKIHFNLGIAYERLGVIDEAIASYRRSRDLDGRDAMTLLNLGMALYAKGEKAGALQELLAAARLNPGHGGILFNAAVVSLELGRMGEARELAARLQRVDPMGASRLQARLAATGR